MANTLEQPILLHQDMADLRTLKKHEVFLTLKRDLAMVSLCFFFFLFSTLAIPTLEMFILTSLFSFLKAIQTTHITEELVDDSYKQMKEEEGRRTTTIEAYNYC